ncbi:MAG: GNAT family N-acetyltransferase [Chloroflexi bacterium]|nr:GNAT family N-acetyltransferase [Chloroflexota bacterium]
MKVQRINSESILKLIPKLAALLQDSVASGASIGFLPPLTDEEADNYWHGVAEALKTPHRILLVAEVEQQIVGTVQLALESRPNGSHRAEIMKLMVHTSMRGNGIAHSLMKAVESEASRAGRSTLILDTREGDPSEHLYSKLGYTRAGAIPEYARSADGNLHSTVVMYKLLGD